MSRRPRGLHTSVYSLVSARWRVDGAHAFSGKKCGKVMPSTRHASGRAPMRFHTASNVKRAVAARHAVACFSFVCSLVGSLAGALDKRRGSVRHRARERRRKEEEQRRRRRMHVCLNMILYDSDAHASGCRVTRVLHAAVPRIVRPAAQRNTPRSMIHTYSGVECEMAPAFYSGSQQTRCWARRRSESWPTEGREE